MHLRGVTDLRFEDLREGQELVSPAVLVSEADILAYAREFDPQPMHVDRDWAATGPFGGLIASGWHTATIAIDLQRQTGLPGHGLTEIAHLSWPRPVRPGDRLQARIEIRSLAPAPDQPGHGLVQFHNTLVNADGETVEIMSGTVLVPRRSRSAE